MNQLKTETKYYREAVISELIKRLTDEALKMIVAMGHDVTWSEFENQWKFKNPDRSMFKNNSFPGLI